MSNPSAPVPARPSPSSLPLSIGCWLAAFLPMLDTSIVNLSLPQLSVAFDLTPSDFGWITNAYLLPLVIMIPITGRLGDVTGRRRLLALGAATFAAASLLAATAGPLETLIAARALQGIGAGALMPMSMALVMLRFPPGAARDRALGWYLSGPAFGGALGPIAGAALTVLGGWRLMFSAQIPVALLVLLLTFAMSEPPMRSARRNLDLPGVALAALTLLAVNVALLRSPGWGWTSLEALASWVVALAGGFAFLARERHAPAPMIELRVFHNRGFVAAAIAGAAVWFSVVSGYVLLPLYLENVRGYEPLHAGLLIAAWPAGALVMFPFAAAVTRAFGGVAVLVGSTGIVFAAAVAMAGFGAATIDVVIVAVGAVLGVATALGNVATAAVATAEFSDADAGVASAVFNTVRQLGSSLGGALPASLLGVLAPMGIHGADSSPALAVTFAARALTLAVALALLYLVVRRPRPDPAAAPAPQPSE